MWIDVSNRLPESSGWYVISLPMPWEGEDAVHVARYDAAERKFYEPLATGQMSMPTGSINAWRPLPKRRPSGEHSFKQIAEGWIYCRKNRGVCEGCPIEYDCLDMDLFDKFEEWLEYIIDATEDRDVSDLSRDEWTEILGV